MNDLAGPQSPEELRNMRVQVTGGRPEELGRARGMLLAEIRAAREDIAPDRAGVRLARRRRPVGPPFWSLSSRPLRSLVLVAGAAVAVVVLLVSLVPGSGTASRPPHAGQRPTGTRSTGTGSTGTGSSGAQTLTAAYILGRAASAAAAATAPVPRPGQYIYVSSVTTYLSVEISKAGAQAWLYKTSRQIWQSVDGQQPGLLQIVQHPNQKLPWGPAPPAIGGNPSGWTSLPSASCPGAAPQRGTYAFLTTLPSDPGRLRTWIYRHPDGGLQQDEEAWMDIGDMLREMLVPPKLAAALFRVAATIPGATVLPDAVNAVGQTGVAVSRSGAELIFDPRTYQLIGEGAVLTKAVAGEGPAGTVTASTAQQQARVVSSLPDIPKSRVDQSDGGVSC
jgi:hypothetical protein